MGGRQVRDRAGTALRALAVPPVRAIPLFSGGDRRKDASDRAERGCAETSASAPATALADSRPERNARGGGQDPERLRVDRPIARHRARPDFPGDPAAGAARATFAAAERPAERFDGGGAAGKRIGPDHDPARRAAGARAEQTGRAERRSGSRRGSLVLCGAKYY